MTNVFKIVLTYVSVRVHGHIIFSGSGESATMQKKSKAAFKVRRIYFSNISKGTAFLFQGIPGSVLKFVVDRDPLLIQYHFCRGGPYKHSHSFFRVEVAGVNDFFKFPCLCVGNDFLIDRELYFVS